MENIINDDLEPSSSDDEKLRVRLTMNLTMNNLLKPTTVF